MTALEWNPPLNLEAEDALLGALLLDNARLADVREKGVVASDFTRQSHGTLYGAIGEMRDAGGAADLVTLTPRLTGSAIERETGMGAAVWLASLMETVPSPAHAVDYAALVRDAAEARRVGTGLARALATLNAFPTAGAIALDDASAQLSDLIRGGVPRGLLTAKEIVRADAADVDAAQRPEAQDRRLRTGLRDLDRLLGELRPGSMTVIAARPSQGKSSAATSLLLRVAVEQSRPCVLVTLEVSAEQALRNVACALALVDGHALMGGRLGEAEFDRFHEARGRVSAAPITVLDESAVTSARVRALARRVATTHGIQLLIVDYLQLLHAVERRNDNREREVARMSADLKAAARESGIAVVVLSQLNRAVENRTGGRPNLSDLRDSGSIEQDADVVVLLSTEETRESDHGPVDLKVLHVAKNRAGPTGAVRLMLHRAWTRFDSADGFELLPAPEAPADQRGSVPRKYPRTAAGSAHR